MIQSASGPSLHIRYEDGVYECPHCKFKYADGHKRETQIMKSVRGYTWRYCDRCGERFGIATNPMSGIRAFDLTEVIK